MSLTRFTWVHTLPGNPDIVQYAATPPNDSASWEWEKVGAVPEGAHSGTRTIQRVDSLYFLRSPRFTDVRIYE